MGRRSAVVGLLLGNMGSMQRETRPSMQREDQPTMATQLEQIAVKARREPNLRFTSLARAAAAFDPCRGRAARRRRRSCQRLRRSGEAAISPGVAAAINALTSICGATAS